MGLPIELGFDSFVACAVAGFVVPRWRNRIAWIAMFGAFDALATLMAGLGCSGIAAVLIAVVAVGLVAVPSFRMARPASLPLLLCLDNLTTALRPIDAVPAGVVSAGMAAAGFVACSLIGVCGARYAGRKYAVPAAVAHVE